MPSPGAAWIAAALPAMAVQLGFALLFTAGAVWRFRREQV
jgi:ABC-2 type transport system permease protein